MTGTISKKLTLATISVLIVALMIFALLGVSAYARAAEEYEGEMILEAVVVGTATESAPGVYRSIAKDDTFTVTYKLVKNDGMVEAAFTPSYDKDAFELTSFAVDSQHWTLFNNYGTVVDEQTGLERPMTAAEFIADRNQKYAAEEIDDFRLTFILSYDDVRDPNGTLSDEFITIVYTARDALVAPATEAAYAFGFDTTSLGGFFTNAAKTGNKLLELKLKVGEEQGEPVTEALGADTFSFHMRSALAISVEEDQTVSFRYNELTGEYYLDPTDIAVTFDEGDKTAYLADEGAALTYVFYTKNAQTGEFEPILDDQTNLPTLPSSPDLNGIYVAAFAAGTDHFDAANSGDPVHVAIAPIYLPLPDLRLYDSAHGEVYSAPGDDLSISFDTAVTYGTTFTLKEVVNNEEALFAMPATSTASATGLNFTYEYTASNAPFAPSANPLDGALHNVGAYAVTISTPDPDFVKFEGTDLSAITIEFGIAQKTVTLTTLINGEHSITLTYGDPAPEASAFTYTGLEAIVETGDAYDAVVAAIHPQIGYRTYPYMQYSNASYYNYYTAGTSTANYHVVTAGVDAVINVDEKPLTLLAEYDGDVVTFSYEGLVNNDVIAVTYEVNGTPIAGDTYTVTAADLGNPITATVRPSAFPAAGYNYRYGESELASVVSVSFAAGDGFGAATGMPDTQYLFAGESATAPASDPTFDGYAFLRWTLAGEPYDFSSAVNQNVTLTAAWEKSKLDYLFRAINSSADLLTGASYALTWDGENEKFVIATTIDPVSGDPIAADTAEAASFLIGAKIPTAITVKGFYVKKWWRVIPQQAGDPIVTEVAAFDDTASCEINEGAYYLAEMVLNVGRGDVNGDGVVSVLDLLAMKRYLVGTTVGELRTEQDAWDAALRDDSNGDWFYPEKWDVNGDGSNDTRDIVALREALATGYGYVIMTDWTAGEEYCEGQQVAKAVVAKNAAAMIAAVEASSPVILGSDVSFDALDQTALDVNVYIDLGGFTITANEWRIQTPDALVVFGGRLNVKDLSFVAGSGWASVIDGNGEDFADDDGTFAWSVEP